MPIAALDEASRLKLDAKPYRFDSFGQILGRTYFDKVRDVESEGGFIAERTVFSKEDKSDKTSTLNGSVDRLKEERL